MAAGFRVFKPTSFGGIAKLRALQQSRIAAARFNALGRLRVRVAGRRPMGLPAFRGFRGVGQRRAAEKKVIDIANAVYQVNTTGSFTLLNGCVQGTDYTNRIGRKIVVKSVYIRGAVYVEPAVTPAVATAPAQQARMILFLDLQPNGAAPAATDLLTAANPYSMLNLNNRDRFRILRDEVFVFDPYFNVTTATQAQAAVTNTYKEVNCYKKLNLESIYNAGNAGTIGDIQSGALYMFWIGSVPAGAADSNANVSTRVRFLDP